jgi:hypothetical protein
MRRIISLFSVAVMVAVMMALGAAPAFAQNLRACLVKGRARIVLYALAYAEDLSL